VLRKVNSHFVGWSKTIQLFSWCKKYKSPFYPKFHSTYENNLLGIKCFIFKLMFSCDFSSAQNIGFRVYVASTVESYSTFWQTLQVPSSGWMKMATSKPAETLDKSQYPMRLKPESRSSKLCFISCATFLGIFLICYWERYIRNLSRSARRSSCSVCYHCPALTKIRVCARFLNLPIIKFSENPFCFCSLYMQTDRTGKQKWQRL
jgi:hypothetical protein